ncbi:MAG: ATP-binding protein [Nitrosomonas sp.]|nr:ATP-binding protein [Nitrosomonas sp.]MDP1951178.1 ATP-binding protein [Nitrosomonas sp.]
MNTEQVKDLFKSLVERPHESEWIEFKQNFHSPDEIGQALSALANSACLHNEPSGYLVFGVEDGTHRITGTSFLPKKKKAKGNEDLEPWLINRLNPRIDFQIYECDIETDQHVVLFVIPAAKDRPVEFQHKSYIRIGSYTKNLQDYPDKQARIWRKRYSDWSAEIGTKASISDLSPLAIKKARELYAAKHAYLNEEIVTWNDITFLNKAKLCISGKVTCTALLLLGKPESEHLLLEFK